MYESHFGFTGAPFSLNPDPAFFFGSRGHSNALSYLKFGVYQGEGFVVVTGEIGAGKTTLVRTLLSELDRDGIVAAQIVSTQLEAGDLLRSVALAFGIAPKNLSKAELIATIEAFLTLLVTENKRALLIVDEAQNLNREAVEELRMLSNFQLGNQALLQSFLVGQPELRTLLTSKPMEQFRQRVIASCHLGPMDAAETRAYIEHRLKQVGWNGIPVFDDAAFDRIFHWAAGIPRRVNLLCNRLLLSAYLAEQTQIDAGAVDVIGEEVRGEVGESAARAEPPRAAAPDAQTAPPGVTTSARAASQPSENEHPVSVVPLAARAALNRTHTVGPLMCVATSAFEDIKMAVLLQALQRSPGAPSAIRVRIGHASQFALNDTFIGELGIDAPAIELNACEAAPTEQIAAVLHRFAPLVDEHRPGVIVVNGGSDSALACSLAASKGGCGLVHVDAGIRARVASGKDAVNGVLIDRMADVFYASGSTAYVNLIREGAGEASVLHAGDLLVDAAQIAAAAAKPPQSLLKHVGGTGIPMNYGLVALDDAIADGDIESITELLSSLREISRDTALIWPMAAAIGAKLDALGLRALATHDRIHIIEAQGFGERVALLGGSAFVVTDSNDVQALAAVLRVRCLRAGPQADPASAAHSELSKPPDGRAAPRMAEHLAGWMAARTRSKQH